MLTISGRPAREEEIAEPTQRQAEILAGEIVFDEGVFNRVGLAVGGRRGGNLPKCQLGVVKLLSSEFKGDSESTFDVFVFRNGRGHPVSPLAEKEKPAGLGSDGSFGCFSSLPAS